MRLSGLRESEIENTEGFSVLVVAPGAETSTYDVFRYTLDSMREVSSEGNVRGFFFHNSIVYHKNALDIAFPGKEQGEIVSAAVVRSAMDVVTDVLLHRPDVVHVIDGTMFPEIMFRSLYDLRNETGRDFLISVHLTEEPYSLDRTFGMVQFIDLVFVNDAYAVDKYDPDGNRHVYYVPHVYHPGVHYDDDRERDIDVFFCGTLFRERAKMFSGVNWDGINVKMIAQVPGDVIDDRLRGVVELGIMDNRGVAECYRRAKIAINLHRVSAMDNVTTIDGVSAYSVGPRMMEAAACGAFQITDARPEVLDVFGTAVATYSSSHELEGLIRWYLKNDSIRRSLAMRSKECVAPFSSNNRSRFMLEKMQIARRDLASQRLGGCNED